jgi:ankyrin repeat protein
MYCNYNNPEVIEDVLKAIADEELDDLRFYLNDGLDPDTKDKWGLPLLVTAVKDGKARAAGVLLAMGADPNIQTPVTHHTPLHYAALGDTATIVALLVKHDAHLEAVDAYGWTPLHMAADRGCVEAVKALVALGANVLAHDPSGETPRDKALTHFHQIHQASHWLCGEHLREAERLLDVEGLKHEKAERDIAVLKGHNPKRFRLKF